MSNYRKDPIPGVKGPVLTLQKPPKGMSKKDKERLGYASYKMGGGKVSKYYSAGGTVITGRD